MNQIAEAKITLTFGETKIELTMDEAKKLLGELQDLVGPKNTIPQLPTPRREDIPFPWDRFPHPIPQRPHHPKWRGDEVICRQRYATLS